MQVETYAQNKNSKYRVRRRSLQDMHLQVCVYVRDLYTRLTHMQIQIHNNTHFVPPQTHKYRHTHTHVHTKAQLYWRAHKPANKDTDSLMVLSFTSSKQTQQKMHTFKWQCTQTHPA